MVLVFNFMLVKGGLDLFIIFFGNILGGELKISNLVIFRNLKCIRIFVN